MTAILLFAVLGGCGGGDDVPPTTVTTEATTTTLPESNAGAVACLRVSTEALQLANDFRQPSRGVVGPTAPDASTLAAGRAEAAALRAEYARLGCPGTILRGFLDS